MSAAATAPAPRGQENYDIESLCKAYCPPLEAGLVYAIASDFDLGDPKSLDDLRRTLDELKESAVVEQDLELLPQDVENSNTHDNKTNLDDKGLLFQNPSNSSQRSKIGAASTTEEDAVTSVTTGISGLKYSDVEDSDFGHDSSYGDAGIEFEGLSDDAKCKWLHTMFPNVKLEDIKDVLTRCNGHFDQSTDELLNVSFLKERNEDHGNQQYIVPKGIEGFLKEDDVAGTRRKTKGKGCRNKSRADNLDSSESWASDSAVSSGAATPNIWKDLPEEVEFIASRTYLKPKAITSIYHANGARLSPTIRALAIKEGEIYRKSPEKINEIMEWQMDELRTAYSHVPDAQIYGLLILANNIPSAAKELLDAMITSNEQPVLLGKVTGLASYTPVNLSEDESKPKKQSGSSWPSAIPTSSGVYTTSHLANSHGMAASQAFQQASAAYRRGKSDHLMGGAAAYYASVGHERIKAAKSMQASAADSHVAVQSSSSVLDLHGVNVSDAVRIAQKGTEAWWEGLGDRKYVVGGRGNGYRVVTGVGRHSSDGIGRIGPAVSKMLVREGWRVEVGRGEIVVSGRARK